MECLLCTKDWPKSYIWINLFKPHNYKANAVIPILLMRKVRYRKFKPCKLRKYGSGTTCPFMESAILTPNLYNLTAYASKELKFFYKEN